MRIARDPRLYARASWGDLDFRANSGLGRSSSDKALRSGAKIMPF